MDSVVVFAFISAAPATTQVAMSMVCKEWARIAMEVSKKYKDLKQAIFANSSIAITRILREGVAMGGSSDLRCIPSHLQRYYASRGNSIAFTRALKGVYISSAEPYYYASRRGLKYARWLVANRFITTSDACILEGLALGNKAVIKRAAQQSAMNENYATVLYTNGHHKLCWWPLTASEMTSVLCNADLISQEALSHVLSGQLRGIRMSPRAISAMTVEQIVTRCDRSNFSEYELYECDSKEKYDVVLRMREGVNAITTDGAYRNIDQTGILTVQRYTSLTQKFDMIKDDCSQYGPVTIYPENYEYADELLLGRLECIVGHYFNIVRKEYCVQTPFFFYCRGGQPNKI
jgi:hypothetical protein